jgi:hypothetical protein
MNIILNYDKITALQLLLGILQNFKEGLECTKVE